ncbi:hypothetical protein [Actinomadura sp. 3N407]|uniref:hypothetical protein n=1 Tax=Actinomadura sp. 3N407 TaxID=3457423 RepID=UPI003FCC6653
MARTAPRTSGRTSRRARPPVYPIAAEDERDGAPELRDSIGGRLAELRDDPARRGAAALAATLTSGWECNQIFDYTVDRTLDGVQARLTALLAEPREAGRERGR